ncbi:hypothetical protein [Paenarthrobacter nitroguajacolicus]|nr:hypothetical protein [Paenarthrobacter nitroguajacolicus]
MPWNNLPLLFDGTTIGKNSDKEVPSPSFPAGVITSSAWEGWWHDETVSS